MDISLPGLPAIEAELPRTDISLSSVIMLELISFNPGEARRRIFASVWSILPPVAPVIGITCNMIYFSQTTYFFFFASVYTIHITYYQVRPESHPAERRILRNFSGFIMIPFAIISAVSFFLFLYFILTIFAL